MKSQLAKLLAENWSIKPTLKKTILEREKAELYGSEKQAQLVALVTRINEMQQALLAKILAADPLFFAEFDHEIQAEAFEKIKSLENPEHDAELSQVESELAAFLEEA